MTEARDRYETIPEEMKRLKQWVIWGINPEKEKCPYTPMNTSVEARANDAAGWADFGAAVSAAARLGRGGIGFEFGVEPCGIAGIDLDHVINDAGELEEWAAAIVKAMDSYTELSPSGQGLHIFCKTNEPMRKFCSYHKKTVKGNQNLEVYDERKYYTVTGQAYGEVKPLQERTEALKKICALYFGEAEERKQKTGAEGTRGTSGSQSNSELWERMFSNAENGSEIKALYSGDISAYNGDDSAADLALCNHLAYWTDCDAARMDSMFRESKLMRPKWDEQRGAQTYGEMTIGKAIAGTRWGNAEDDASTGEEKGNAGTTTGAAEESERVKPVSEYLNDFLEECRKSREGQAIKTHITSLDERLDGGLYPGLYFMGAVSALGKTTLALQIADNIAKGGHEVLIYSLEMSRSELMAKTLSRESLLRDLSENRTKAHALSTRGILRASFTSDEQRRLVREAVEDYEVWGRKLAIVEGVGDLGVQRIAEYVKGFVKRASYAPVVVIDYLQLLAPYSREYVRASDKQNVDKNVMELKRLSRDYQIPIIGISSFNRENYNAPVSMASFKESGAIEYSSDVLIGLQIDGIERAAGESEQDYKGRLQKTLETVSACKSRGEPVAIEAKILKHRNGAPGSVHFNFHSRFNYFEDRGSTAL